MSTVIHIDAQWDAEASVWGAERDDHTRFAIG